MSDRAFTEFFVLLATATSCAVVALAVPRQASPYTLPALSLAPEHVAAQEARDREVMEKAHPLPGQAEHDRLFLAHGRTERDPEAPYDADRLRQLSFYVEPLSDQARNQLRVEATERALACLLAACPGAEAEGLLGSFPAFLRENALLSARDTWRAPRLTVRAAYKARWNRIHHLLATDGLDKIELQALEGFKALHAAELSMSERAQAARRFHEVGGKRSAEAMAAFSAQSGAPDEAIALLERAHAQRPELRLRNRLLALWAESAQATDDAEAVP